MVGELLHAGALRPVAQALDGYLVEAHVVERLDDGCVRTAVDPCDGTGRNLETRKHLREISGWNLLRPLRGHHPYRVLRAVHGTSKTGSPTERMTCSVVRPRMRW